LIFFFCASRWFCGPFRRNFWLLSKTTELYYPLTYIFISVACTSTVVYLAFQYGRIQDFDESALLINNLIYSAYALFMIFISMRMVKSEVLQGLYALLQSKKEYVRYISHELRTPLNAVCRKYIYINVCVYNNEYMICIHLHIYIYIYLFIYTYIYTYK
jgi:hypothetical protein